MQYEPDLHAERRKVAVSILMPRSVVRAAALLPLVAGCASVTGTTASNQRVYGIQDIIRVRDSLQASGDEGAEQGGTPRVRILVPPTLDAGHYVDAAIRVSDDAYVLVVAADLDGRMRVLYPESPEQSGFLTAEAPHKLSRFFAGFGPVRMSRYSYAGYGGLSSNPMALNSTDPSGRYAARGAIVAIASDRPLQLARIADEDGGWNEFALERLTLGRSIQSAGYALASELSLAGQQYDLDYSGLSEWGSLDFLSQSGFGSLCHDEFTGAAYYDGPRPTRFFVHDGVRYALVTVFGECGRYEQRIVPVGPAEPINPRPVDSTTRTPMDSASGPLARSRVAGRINASDSSRAAAIERFGETVSRARRSSPIPTDGSTLKPADSPNIVAGLRFRPPDRVRPEPVVRSGGYGLSAEPGSLQDHRDGRFRGSDNQRPMRDDRQRSEQARGESPPAREAAPRREPPAPREAAPRREPPPVREAPVYRAPEPMRDSPAPVASAPSAPSGKPVKE